MRPGALGERLDRGGQAELVERGRAQLGDQRAQVGDLAVELVDGVGQQPRRCVSGSSCAARRPSSRAAAPRGSAASRRAARAPSAGARPRRPRRRWRGARAATSARWRRRSPRSPRRTPAAARRRRRSSGRRSRRSSAISTPYGAPAEDQRDERGPLAANAEPAEAVALEARAVERVLQALRALRAQRGLGDGLVDRDAPAEQRGRDLAGRRGDHELVAVEQLDHQRARGDQRAAALGDELAGSASRSVSPPSASAIWIVASQRGDRPLSSSRARLGAGVAPGVVDRDAGEVGEQHERLLVVVGERLAAVLLGQVEVAVGLAARRGPARRGTCASAGVRAGSRRSAGARRRRRAAAARDARSARRARRARVGSGPIGRARRVVDAARDEARERRCRTRRGRRSPRSARRSARGRRRARARAPPRRRARPSTLCASPRTPSIRRPLMGRSRTGGPGAERRARAPWACQRPRHQRDARRYDNGQRHHLGPGGRRSRPTPTTNALSRETACRGGLRTRPTARPG